MKDVLNVVTYGDISAGSYVTLTDLTGRILRSVLVYGQETKIVISDLPPGLYIVKYVSGSYVKTFEISKKD